MTSIHRHAMHSEPMQRQATGLNAVVEGSPSVADCDHLFDDGSCLQEYRTCGHHFVFASSSVIVLPSVLIVRGDRIP
jgi:hypothetical protein